MLNDYLYNIKKNLITAVEEGNKDIIENILAIRYYNKDLNKELIKLFREALNKRNKAETMYLAFICNLNLQKNISYYRALIIAIKQEKIDIIKVFLAVADGYDKDLTDANGSTVLHIAVDLGSKDIVGMLLSIGCNQYLRDTHGRTSLDLAVDNGSTELVKLILSTNDYKDLKGNIQYLRIYMLALSNKDKRNKENEKFIFSIYSKEFTKKIYYYIALLAAVIQGKIEIVKSFLAASGHDEDLVDILDIKVLNTAEQKEKDILDMRFELGCAEYLREVRDKTSDLSQDNEYQQMVGLIFLGANCDYEDLITPLEATEKDIADSSSTYACKPGI